MMISNVELATPLDKAYAYDMSWRHEAAKAINDGKAIHTLCTDDCLFAQMQYLGLIDDVIFEECLEDIIADKLTTDSDLKDVAAANKIYQSSLLDHTRERLEAMLLCPELDYYIIGHEFNTRPNVVRMFEKLFFNIRDDNGKLLGNTGLVMYAALKGALRFEARGKDSEYIPAHWRIVAFEGGYKPLYAIWGWQAKGELTNLTYTDLSVDMMRSTYRQMDKLLRFTDRIDIRGLAQILTTLTQQFADMRKGGILSDKDVIDPSAMMLKVIELLAPERILESKDALVLAQKDLDGKLTAVMAKEGRSVGDKPTAFKHIEAQLNKGAPANV